MENILKEEMESYFEYLDNLRESSATNIVGAIEKFRKYGIMTPEFSWMWVDLEMTFELEPRIARKVLMRWMETFAERH